MIVRIYETEQEVGKAAAETAASILRDAINEKGEAVFSVATGVSQFEFLKNLTSIASIDWSKTTMFHLDEYVGISGTHPGSFRKYLKERLINKVYPRTTYLIVGDAKDSELECERLSGIVKKKDIDVTFLGIGENGHLAFNDPPANFDTNKPYLIVELDEKCRMQQVREGWFRGINEVPRRAISMSVKQIMKSKNVVCIVPGGRKAQAVKDCFEGDISRDHPGSILRKHNSVFLFLDKNSARLIDKCQLRRQEGEKLD